MVQLVQQQLYPDRKAKSLGVVQSTRLHVSAGLRSTLNAEKVSNDTIEGMPQHQTDELASKGDIKPATRKSFPVPCSFVWAANKRRGPDIVSMCVWGGGGSSHL